MNQARSSIYIFILFAGVGAFAVPSFFTLPDLERTLILSEDNLQGVFICSQAGSKVFGKNPANSKDCYLLEGSELSETLAAFFSNVSGPEKQIGIYQEDSKQLHPEWIEPGKEEAYILLNFVISKDRQFFVQCLRKRDKQYFYFKSKREFWKTEKR